MIAMLKDLAQRLNGHSGGILAPLNSGLLEDVVIRLKWRKQPVEVCRHSDYFLLMTSGVFEGPGT